MSIFICPICKESLELANRTFRCKNNHCFDLAKEGYVNLLPINSKKSRLPGDSSKMIQARRSFLEAGYYQTLAERLSIIINELLDKREASNILDLGCGEGYYTGHISNLTDNRYNFSALDISKVAVKYGSKRYKDVNFCVASAFNMPIQKNSIDLLYRVYAPSSHDELERVIKKGGYLITVTPGERHLYSLREIIYDKVLNLSTKSDESDIFTLIKQETLTYTMFIEEKEHLSNLIDMTPFGWKIKPEDREKLLSQKSWDIECDFNISILQKRV